jgi:hypothetical protein
VKKPWRICTWPAPLEEAVRGVTKEIRIPTLEECDVCHGSGAKAGTRTGLRLRARFRAAAVADVTLFQRWNADLFGHAAYRLPYSKPVRPVTVVAR